jgi:hypothetical protein
VVFVVDEEVGELGFQGFDFGVVADHAPSEYMSGRWLSGAFGDGT